MGIGLDEAERFMARKNLRVVKDVDQTCRKEKTTNQAASRG